MSQASNHQWLQTCHFYSNPKSWWFRHISTITRPSFIITILQQEFLCIVKGSCYYKLNVCKPPTSSSILCKVTFYFQVLKGWRHPWLPHPHKDPHALLAPTGPTPFHLVHCSYAPPHTAPKIHHRPRVDHWLTSLNHWPRFHWRGRDNHWLTRGEHRLFTLSTEVELNTLSSEGVNEALLIPILFTQRTLK